MQPDIKAAKAELQAALCREDIGQGLNIQRHERGLSLYGLKRNCLTLSVAEWKKLCSAALRIQAYIHKHQL